MRWFGRHGRKAVLFARLVPAVRTLVSVPAGVLGIGRRRILAYATVGTAVWTAVLGWAGRALGARYEAVSGWIGPVSNAILAGLVLCYHGRVATFERRARAGDSPATARGGRSRT